MSEPEAIADYKGFYNQVYGRDAATAPSHGWIQWKGTNVCIDLCCECGHNGHVDGEFFYFYECSACGRKYAIGQTVKLIPLTPEEVTWAESDDSGCCPFVKDDGE